MRIAVAHLKSASPYCQGRPLQSPKQRDETHDEHERRCWRERCHVDEEGMVFIPPFAFKNALAQGAKFKGIQIPGRGKERYTKHFESGVLVHDPMPLGVKIADVQEFRHFVPSDGARGGKKRVWKSFPIFHKWEGDVQFYVLDNVIDEEVFETHLIDTGQFIGLGTFRVSNNGYFGRFSVESIKWEGKRIAA